MLRRLMTVLAAIAFAILGALVGRLVADLRRQSEAQEQRHVELDSMSVRPRDVMPGLVAALRVRDRPWSYLHIPSWLAAFSVNFAFAALSHELGPLLRTLRGEDGDDEEDEWRRPYPAPAPSTEWSQPPRGPRAPEPTPGFQPFAD
jgi:hypothetical protein